MVAGAVRLRGTLAEAVSSLLDLPALTVVGVLTCWVVVVVARASLYRWSLPGAGTGQGLVLDQVNLAVANSVPGGGIVSATLRYRIGRSLGHRPEDMALSMLAVGEAMSVARWLLIVAVLLGSIVTGAASGLDLLVLGSAVAAVGASAVFWWVVSCDTAAGRWLVRQTQRAVDRIGRRVPALRETLVEPFVGRLRVGAGSLLRHRTGALLAGSAAVTMGGALIVVLVVQGVQGQGAPGAWDVVRVYLLARVAAGFSPTPGGVGVVEGTLAVGLVAAGADPAAAFAAVLVYRGLTYALPIVTGSAVYLGWRRWQRLPRRTPRDPAALGHTGSHGAVAERR
nr:lysylphosphatidylglycerol synthase domain-containing protein [Rhabdothermincola salaria]